MEITINTIQEEKQVVEMTKGNLDFLKENKIKFSLSKKQVEEDYEIENYQQFKEKLSKRWKEEGGGFLEKLINFFDRDFKKEDFSVKISNYGPLGFYYPKKKAVVINMREENDQDQIDLIKHELVHIFIESFIRKYSLGYEKKEKIAEEITRIINLS